MIDDLIVFTHIPKTAGSTLRSVLKAAYPEPLSRRFSPMKDILTDDHDSYARHLRSFLRSCQENPHLQLVYGHVLFGVHVHIKRKCQYATILRHPIDRVLSNYYYRAEHGYCTSPNLSLADYLSGKSPMKEMQFEADNTQTRFLSALDGTPQAVPFGACTPEMLTRAKANLNSYLLVGLTERFSDTIELFGKILSWKIIPPHSIERATKPYPKRESTSREIINIAEQNNALDLELFEHAVSLFNKRTNI